MGYRQTDFAQHEQAGEDAESWATIDLLLQQGDSDDIAGMRRQVAENPSMALQLADTVAILEQMRQLRTDASPEFAGKLAYVTARAERRLSGCDDAYRGPRHLPWVALLAAAATFACLWLLDPVLRRRDPRPTRLGSFALQSPEPTSAGAARPVAELPRDYAEVEWESAVEVMRTRLELESSPRMRDAFEAGLQDARDPLSQWLDPRNAIVLLRLDHELRASADVRAAALRRTGSLPAVDARVQDLADAIADDLLLDLAPETDRERLAHVAWGVRALIGAGSTTTRAAALERSGAWLSERLPLLQGESLVLALSGLMELAAISDQHFEIVAEHGMRLVDEVLQPDSENWERWRPELLRGNVAADTLGEAARILSRLPAFGAAPGRCTLVRQLLLGQLRERRDRGQDRPEVLAAMLYGSPDLLAESERDAIEAALQRWKPVRLAPDFVTVQQLAWGLQPGRRGFARLQGELRQLAVLPIPSDPRDRAAFCLCLATNYAGVVGGLLPAVELLHGI